MSIAVKIGCDPELFLANSKNQPISAFNVIPGDKRNPHKVDSGAVQVDGMALEFNIDPAETAYKFSTNISKVMKQLEGMIPKGTKFKIAPVAMFGEEYIKKQPLAARELGCDPDFNAWQHGARNPRPDGAVDFRTASGHIHIGWGNDFDIQDPEHLEACMMMVKQLDMILLPLSMMWDKNNKRRELYGMPGAFRPKPYGVEYRVLSNAWISKAYLRKFVFDLTKTCFDMLVRGETLVSKSSLSCERFVNSVSSRYNSSDNILRILKNEHYRIIWNAIRFNKPIREVLFNHPKILEMINEEYCKVGMEPFSILNNDQFDCSMRHSTL